MSFSSTARTPGAWVRIGEKLAAPVSAERAFADRILSDLLGYRKNSMSRNVDVENLGNALEAYAYMIQQAGVKVEVADLPKEPT